MIRRRAVSQGVWGVVALVMGAACGPQTDQSTHRASADVTIVVPGRDASMKALAPEAALAPSPASVASIRVTVTDSGGTILASTQAAVSPDLETVLTLEVPAGAGRRFAVEAWDAAHSLIFYGETTTDLPAGRTTQVTVFLEDVAISIDPASASVALGASRSFTARLTGTPDAAFIWSVGDVVGGNAFWGTLTPTNPTVYTAPGMFPGGSHQIVIRATTVSSPLRSAASTVTLLSATVDTGRLGVELSGSGAGAVFSDPSGIACPSTCAESYPRGTVVTLTADPDTGSVFEGWSGGACSGTGACTLAVEGDVTVGAQFGRQTVTLKVSFAGDGDGLILSNPPGIACSGSCDASFLAGTAVTLEAVPDASSYFKEWREGGCGGAEPCTVHLTADTEVRAIFCEIGRDKPGRVCED